MTTCTTYCQRQAKRQTRIHGGSFRRAKANCRLIFCNPTCAGTSFGSRRLTRKQLSRLSKGAAFRKRFKSTRRALKGRLLNNGFYVRIPEAEKKSLRKQGALSGCYDTE